MSELKSDITIKTWHKNPKIVAQSTKWGRNQKVAKSQGTRVKKMASESKNEIRIKNWHGTRDV